MSLLRYGALRAPLQRKLLALPAGHIAAPSRPLATRPRRGAEPARGPKMNDAVARMRTVRLVGETGHDRGEMSGRDALSAAQSVGLDALVVREERGKPAVVRLVDYRAMTEAMNRKSYLQKKQRKASQMDERRSQTLKQVRLSPSTGDRDFEMKMENAKKFLLQGYRVRVFMQFRRGQGRLHESAKVALSQAAEVLVQYGTLAGKKDKKSTPGTSVDELFPPPPPVEDGAPEEPRKPKPLEIQLTCLRKAEREKLVAALEAEGTPLEDIPAVDDSDSVETDVDDQDEDPFPGDEIVEKTQSRSRPRKAPVWEADEHEGSGS